MGMRFFLYRFETSGLRNIGKPLVLGFHDAKIPNKLDLKATNVKGIFGPNGSGKTSILLSLLLLKNIATDSDYLSKSGDYLNSNLSFLGMPFQAKAYFACYDEEKENEITDFLAYEVMLNKEAGHWRLVKESISTFTGNSINRNERVLFETRDGEISMMPRGLSDKGQAGLQERLWNRLTSSSLVSLSESFKDDTELKRIAGLVKTFFRSLSIFIDEQNTFNPNDMSKTEAGIVNEAPSKIGDVKDRLCRVKEFIRLFKPTLKDIIVNEKPSNSLNTCNLTFVYEDYSVPLALESRGIRKIISIYEKLEGVARGGIGFIDGLDASIHEVYLEKLFSFFTSYSKGQLVFTSNSLAPMRALENGKHAIHFLSDQGDHEEWTRHSRYRASRLYHDGMIAGNPFNVEDYTFYRIFFGSGKDHPSKK